MRILLLLLSLAAIGWFAKPYLKPYLMGSPDEPPNAASLTHTSPRAATRPSGLQGADVGGEKSRPDIQALRNEVRTAPPLNWTPPEVVNQDPRAALQPAISPEEQAAIRARADEAMREMKERGDAYREEMIRQQKSLRRMEKKAQDQGIVLIPR